MSGLLVAVPAGRFPLYGLFFLWRTGLARLGIIDVEKEGDVIPSVVGHHEMPWYVVDEIPCL